MDPKVEGHKMTDGWRGTKAERQRLIREARRTYDADGLLLLLESAPSDYPNLQGLRLWSRLEKQRQAQIQYARAHRDWDRVLALLDGAPPDYPALGRLRAEALAARQPANQSNPPLQVGQAEPADGQPAPTAVPCPQMLAMGGGQEAYATLPTPAEADPGEAKEPELLTEAGSPAGAAGESELPVPSAALARVAVAVGLCGDGPSGLAQVRTSAAEPAAAVDAAAEALMVVDRAAAALAGARWRQALAAIAELPAAAVSALSENDRRRLGGLVLATSAAAEAAREWPAAAAALRLLADWGIADRRAEQTLADIDRKREADRLVAAAQADLAAGRCQEALEAAEAAERAWPGFPGALGVAEQARGELARAAGRPHRKVTLFAVPAALALLMASAVVVWGAQSGTGPAGFLATVTWPTFFESTHTPTPTAEAAQPATALAAPLRTATPAPSPTPTTETPPTPTVTATPAASRAATNTSPPTSTVRPAVYTSTPIPARPTPPVPTATRPSAPSPTPSLVPPTNTRVPTARTVAPPTPANTPTGP